MSDALGELLASTQRIAVIGMRRAGGGAANSVPEYMERHGYEIVPGQPEVCGDRRQDVVFARR